MAQNRITIPVGISVSGYKEQLEQIKKAFSNIRLDTNLGKQFSGIVRTIQSELRSLERKMASGVHSNSDIFGLNDNLLRIEHAFEALQGLDSQINFSNLTLPDEVIGQFAALDAAVKKATKDLDNLQEVNMRSLKGNKDFANKVMQFTGLNQTQYNLIENNKLSKKLNSAAINQANIVADQQEARRKAQSNYDALLAAGPKYSQADLQSLREANATAQAAADTAQTAATAARQTANAMREVVPTGRADRTTGAYSNFSIQQLQTRKAQYEQAITQLRAQQANNTAQINEWSQVSAAMTQAAKGAQELAAAESTAKNAVADKAATQIGVRNKRETSMLGALNGEQMAPAPMGSTLKAGKTALEFISNNWDKYSGMSGTALQNAVAVDLGKQQQKNWKNIIRSITNQKTTTLSSLDAAKRGEIEAFLQDIGIFYEKDVTIGEITKAVNKQFYARNRVPHQLHPYGNFMQQFPGFFDKDGRITMSQQEFSQNVAAIDVTQSAEQVKANLERTAQATQKQAQQAEAAATAEEEVAGAAQLTATQRSNLTTRLKGKDFKDGVSDLSTIDIAAVKQQTLENASKVAMAQAEGLFKFNEHNGSQTLKNADLADVSKFFAQFGQFDLSGIKTYGDLESFTKKVFDANSADNPFRAITDNVQFFTKVLGISADQVDRHIKSLEASNATITRDVKTGYRVEDTKPNTGNIASLQAHNAQIDAQIAAKQQGVSAVQAAEANAVAAENEADKREQEARDAAKAAERTQEAVTKAQKHNSDIDDAYAKLQEAITKGTVAENTIKEITALQKLVDAAPEQNKAQLQQALAQAINNRLNARNQYLAQVQEQAKGASQQASTNVQKQTPKNQARVEAASQALAQNQNMQKAMQTVNAYTNRLVGSYAIFNKITQAVRSAWNEIQTLDKAISGIAVVTNMSAAQLWGQIHDYTAIAKEYGVTTEGVYQVSQLYYQMGLSSAEVTSLTTETLKMAKIAGLDYSTATDYMASALNGFKMQASDASSIVDTYSALAATAATTTKELATAMSKTASIAEASGMSMQSTSAMLTMMIETTRESPENLGTALKSMIARFQKIDENPKGLINIDGETTSFNDVDAALRTVGVSLTDTTGQMRNLDEVIFELAAKWDTLDRNTQKWIANEAAGSRQQSRFLALMSDNSRLTELYNTAMNSQDAALVQQAKTMDSLQTKIANLKNTFTEFYTSIISGQGIKDFIDIIQSLFDKFNNGLPGMLSGITQIINVIKTIKSLSTLATGVINLRYTGSMFTGVGMPDVLRRSAGRMGFTGAQQSNLGAAPGMVPSGVVLPNGATLYQQYKIDKEVPNITVTADNVTAQAKTMTAEPDTVDYKNAKHAYDFAVTRNTLGYGTQQQLTNAQNNMKAAMVQGNMAPAFTKLTGIDLAQGYQNATAQVERLNTALNGLTPNTKAYDEVNAALKAATERQGMYAKALTSSGKQQTDAMNQIIAARNQQIDQSKSFVNGINAFSATYAAQLRMLAAAVQVVGTTIANLMRNAANNNDKLSTGEKRRAQGKASMVEGGASAISGAINGVVTASLAGTAIGKPAGLKGMAVGAILGALAGIIQIATNTKPAFAKDSTEELQKDAQKAKVKSAEKTNDYKQIDTLDKKLQTLRAHMYDSQQSMDSYQQAVKNLGDLYPELITAYDAQGNAIDYNIESLKTLVKLRREEAAQSKLAANKKQYQALNSKKSEILGSSLVDIVYDPRPQPDFKQGQGKIYGLRTGETITVNDQYQLQFDTGDASFNFDTADWSKPGTLAEFEAYWSSFLPWFEEHYNLPTNWRYDDAWRPLDTTLGRYNASSYANLYEAQVQQHDDIVSWARQYQRLFTDTTSSLITADLSWYDREYGSDNTWFMPLTSTLVSAYLNRQTEFTQDELLDGEHTVEIQAHLRQFSRQFIFNIDKFTSEVLGDWTEAQRLAFKSGDFSQLTGRQWHQLMEGDYGDLTAFAIDNFSTSSWSQNSDLIKGNLTKYGVPQAADYVDSQLQNLTPAQLLYVNNSIVELTNGFKDAQEGSSAYAMGQYVAGQAYNFLVQIYDYVNNNLNDADKTTFNRLLRDADFGSNIGIMTFLSELQRELPQVYESLGVEIIDGIVTITNSPALQALIDTSGNTSTASLIKTLGQNADKLSTFVTSYYKKIITGTLNYGDLTKMLQQGFKMDDFELNAQGTGWQLKGADGTTATVQQLVRNTLVEANEIIIAGLKPDLNATKAWLQTNDNKQVLYSDPELIQSMSDQERAAVWKYKSQGYDWGALTVAEQRLLANIYARTQDWKTVLETYRNQLQNGLDEDVRTQMSAIVRSFGSLNVKNGKFGLSDQTYQQILSLRPDIKQIFDFNYATGYWEMAADSYQTYMEAVQSVLEEDSQAWLDLSQFMTQQQYNYQSDKSQFAAMVDYSQGTTFTLSKIMTGKATDDEVSRWLNSQTAGAENYSPENFIRTGEGTLGIQTLEQAQALAQATDNIEAFNLAIGQTTETLLSMSSDNRLSASELAELQDNVFAQNFIESYRDSFGQTYQADGSLLWQDTTQTMQQAMMDWLDTIYVDAPGLATYYKQKIKESITSILQSGSNIFSAGNIGGVDEKLANKMTIKGYNFEKGADGKFYLNLTGEQTAQNYMNSYLEMMRDQLGADSMEFQTWYNTTYPQLLQDALTFDNKNPIDQVIAEETARLQGQGSVYTQRQVESIVGRLQTGTASEQDAATYRAMFGYMNGQVYRMDNGFYSLNASAAQKASDVQSLWQARIDAQARYYEATNEVMALAEGHLNNGIFSGTLDEAAAYSTAVARQTTALEELIQATTNLTAVQTDLLNSSKQYASEVSANNLISAASSGQIETTLFDTFGTMMEGTVGRTFYDNFADSFTEIGDSMVWTDANTDMYQAIQAVIDAVFVGEQNAQIHEYFIDMLQKSIYSALMGGASIFSSKGISGINAQAWDLWQRIKVVNPLTGEYQSKYSGVKGPDGLFYITLQEGQSALQAVDDYWMALEVKARAQDNLQWFNQQKAQQYTSDRQNAIALDTNSERQAQNALRALGNDYVITVSSQIWQLFGDAKDQFTLTADGYQWTSGPLSYLQLVESVVDSLSDEAKARFLNSSQYLSAKAQAKQLEANKAYSDAELQIAANAEYNNRRTGAEYRSMLDDLYDKGVSLQQAAILSKDLGIALDNWYPTANGTYKVIRQSSTELKVMTSTVRDVTTGTKTISEGYNDVDSKIKQIITQMAQIRAGEGDATGGAQARLAVLNNQLQVLQSQKVTLAEMARMEFEKSLNLGSSGIGSTGDPGTFLSNLGSLEESFRSFNETGKIGAATLWNVVDNLGLFDKQLPSTISGINGLNAATATYGDLLANLTITWDDSGNAQFSLPGVDAQAITGNIEDSIKALVQGQVKFWSAMVKFYEGLEALKKNDEGNYEIQIGNIKAKISGDQHILWNGQEYTVDGWIEAFKSIQFENAEQISIMLGIDPQFIIQGDDGSFIIDTSDGRIAIQNYAAYILGKQGQYLQDMKKDGIDIPLNTPLNVIVDSHGNVTVTGPDWVAQAQALLQQQSGGAKKQLNVTIDDAVYHIVVSSTQVDSVEVNEDLESQIQAAIQEAGPGHEGPYSITLDGVSYTVNVAGQTKVDLSQNTPQISGITPQIEAINSAATLAGGNVDTLVTSLNSLTNGLDTSGVTESLGEIQQAAENVGSAAQTASGKINSLGSGLSVTGILAKIALVAASLFTIQNKNITINVNTSAAIQVLQNFKRLYDSIASKTITLTQKTVTSGSSGGSGSGAGAGGGLAGNELRPAVATGTRNASGGRTLVGQLGPELLVRDGQYHILGSEGAQFVDLQRGDIVFDAKKTDRLLNDKPGVRGVAMAHGGTVGPAASSGLDTARKQLAYWSSLASSLTGLLSSGGGTGGGGGGGGSSKQFEMNLQRWFNWLKQIASLENKINQLRAKRQNQTGGQVARSLIEQNNLLARQASVYQNLADSQQAYRRTLQADISGKYGDYFYFLQDGTMQINYAKIKTDTTNNQNLADDLDEAMSEYTSLMDSISQNIQSVQQAMTQITANIKVIQTAYVDMQNEILQALKSNYQRQIDMKTQTLEKKKQADKKYLDSLKKNLQKQKKLREDNRDQEEIKDLQRKIALLQRDTSGKNAKELAKLRQQLRESREDNYYNKRKDVIDDLSDAFDKQTDYYQAQIDALTEANEIKLHNMKLYWDQVADIVATGQQGILDFLQSSSMNYLNSSALQREIYICEWNNTIGVALEYANASATCWFSMINALIARAAGLCTHSAVNGTPALSQGTNNSSSNSTGGSGSSSSSHKTKTQTLPKYVTDSMVVKKASYDNWDTKHQYPYYTYTYNGKTVTKSGGVWKYSDGTIATYKTGGLVDYTGPAWVDGSPKKPELMLNADDTENMLRYIELMNKLNLQDIQSFVETMSDYNGVTSNETNNGVTIGDVNITIESGVVTTQAQSQALSKTIANELMSIARQSGTVSVKRR